MTAASPAPHVYRAINRITAAFARDGIDKTHVNLVEQYQYRSIDDVLNRLGPLLAKHRLCVLPRVVAREERQVPADLGAMLASVTLEVEFDLVSARDGSRHVVRSWGEALDGSDKGTAKAMSAAFKAAMIEAFCIPVGNEDSDRRSHRRRQIDPASEPPGGWSGWCAALETELAGCTSADACDSIRRREQGLLLALQREQPALYADFGKQFAKCRQDLADAPRPTSKAGVEIDG